MLADRLSYGMSGAARSQLRPPTVAYTWEAHRGLFGGWLPPVAGAVFPEVVDLAAVLNALRAAVPGGELSGY